MLFFLVHYGIFHAAYAVFILIAAAAPYWPDVIASGTAFFANHLFSYFMNRNRAGKRIPNIGSMMFFPYIRIIPMHVFIVFGAFAAGPGISRWCFSCCSRRWPTRPCTRLSITGMRALGEVGRGGFRQQCAILARNAERI